MGLTDWKLLDFIPANLFLFPRMQFVRKLAPRTNPLPNVWLTVSVFPVVPRQRNRHRCATLKSRIPSQEGQKTCRSQLGKRAGAEGTLVPTTRVPLIARVESLRRCPPSDRQAARAPTTQTRGAREALF